MAFISLIFTALNLKKLQKTLVEEKLDAIRAQDNESFKKKFKLRHIGIDLKIKLKTFLRGLFSCSEKCPLHKTCYKLRREGSCENYVLKSLFGFVGGVLLTYLLYIFFIFQLNVKLTNATMVCSFLGCILTVGLAFSSKVRCIVLLTLPQFFSKRGRQALLAYAFALALTGPAQNTLHNMGILSESLACGQEQLKQAVKQIIDVIKKPFLAIKEAIKKVIKTIKEVVKKIKEILLKIKRIVMALVRIIKSVFEFLGKIINICNKELGTPFERCTRVFENAIADCNAKLGPLFSWLCSITYIVKAVCYIVKVFDYVCMLVDFISDSVVGVVIRKVKIFVRHIKTMFYVRIKFAHSFEFQTTSSKSITEIAREIVSEISDRSRGIVAFFNFMTSAIMLFFLYIVFQVTYYRLKYLTNERFDNIYITKYFREIDQRRAKHGKETVLPLTKREQKVYVPISSGKLAQSERKKLSKAIVALATASVKLATHMVADYSLYWILTMITYHGRYQSKIQAPNLPVAHVSGEGFLATLLRAIVNAFQPVGIKMEIDTVPCLPIPIPPDFDRYAQIGITLLICWILTILEPYGLRFRNYIMGYYHPVRAKQRTIWLYNHILRYRSSFLLFARRQLKRKFGGKGIEEVSCMDHFKAKLDCGIFRICFGKDLQTACLLCGEVFRERNRKRFIKCQTPGCPGIFCLECFEDLDNICPICLSPIEYGDLEDEEKDSSGDEPPKKHKPKKKPRCRWFSCLKPRDDDKQPLVPEKKDEDEEKEPVEQEGLKEVGDVIPEESDASTDYSYSYQYDEDQREPYPKTVIFKDVEKQHFPDYASMESFRDEGELLCVDLDNEIRVPKGHTALIEMDVKTRLSEEYLGEEHPSSFENKEETEPLLETSLECICSNQASRHVEFVGLPNCFPNGHKKVKRKLKIIDDDTVCCCSDLELLENLKDNTVITHPKSTMSTSTRTDCKYCRASDLWSTWGIGSETEEDLRQIVPPLDLSFLDKERKTCTCNNPILSNRFRNVNYEEVCEKPSPPPSQRSLASSSVLSSLESSPSPASDERPQLRRRHIGTQCRAITTHYTRPTDDCTEIRRNINAQVNRFKEEDSPSSMDSYEFNKAQNRRVKQYYESTRRKIPDYPSQQPTKKKLVRSMFGKLIPKRNSGQNYLPLHSGDIEDPVKIQSYNYCQENWDTLSGVTDSPTYPFGSQIITSDTSEEDQHLLGGGRIRGGECTHLINCKLIGIRCSQRQVRTFDAKSRTQLKDFTTLSLPPIPKPSNTKELLERYFQKSDKPIISSASIFSMKSIETNKPSASDQRVHLTDRKESSDFVINKSAVSILSLKEDATPPSSESGLSEDTCQAIFGQTCPRGVGKRFDESKFDDPQIPEASPEIVNEDVAKASEADLQDQTLDSITTKAPLLSVDKNSVKETEDLPTSRGSNRSSRIKLESQFSQASVISKNNKPVQQSKETEVNTETGGENQFVKTESIQSNLTKTTSSRKIETLEKIPSSSKNTEDEKITEPVTDETSRKLSGSVGPKKTQEQITSYKTNSQIPCKVRSAQLNQLLYKDEKTEISLVQKLSPDKGVIKSRPSSTKSSQIIPRSIPSVRLQISLNNSIIQEEPAAESQEYDKVIAMKTPKSRDKIVETQETYPLRSDWTSSNSSRSGKLILASDKTQQTSDNDFYRSSNALDGSSKSKLSSTVRPSSALQSVTSLQSEAKVSHLSRQRYSSTYPKYTSTDDNYYHEEPERDLGCKESCRCHLCRNAQIPLTRDNYPSATHGEHGECPYNCCRCVNQADDQTYRPENRYREVTASRDQRTRYSRPLSRNYHMNTFAASETENDLPFPPPPPPPLLPRQRSPSNRTSRDYSPSCFAECSCCLKQHQHYSILSKEYNQTPAGRYPRDTSPTYDYRDTFDRDLSDDDRYNYPRKPSLSELPYQNNDEYLELVEELQDTLHSRNRNRVKRAMREFESRSKQNKPLEKPIINYDETSESEEPIIRKIDQLRTDRKICCAEDKCSCIKRNKNVFARDRFNTSERPSHWTMDPNSGEWSKACRCCRFRGPKGARGLGELTQCNCNCELSKFQ